MTASTSAPPAQPPAVRPPAHHRPIRTGLPVGPAHTLPGRAGWLAPLTGRPGGRLYLTLAACALALATLSLLLPSTPSYDPWAWLIWGREILHLNLHTAGGPSWKPLPVMFTTAFAPFGAAAPALWLVIARAGAAMALAMVFRLAYRLTRGLATGAGSPTGKTQWAVRTPALLAGLIAAGSLVNSGGFIVENGLGYSEGLAIALMLIAVERALDRAPRPALVVGFLACLDRPELWIVWVPFGVWLWRRDPASRRLVLGLFALTPALWFLPELWGSGHLLRGVARAHHPRPGTAAFTRCPACTVFVHEAWPTLMRRVKLPAIAALAAAAGMLWHQRAGGRERRPISPAGRSRLWLVGFGVAGFLWWLGIAAETQGGFAGNRRYLELGTALVAIAGGVAWGWFSILAARALRRVTVPRLALPGGTAVAVAALVGTPPWIGRNIINLDRAGRALNYQADLRSDLARAVTRAGGRSVLVRCGTVMTEAYQVPMVAWTLGLTLAQVKPPPVSLSGRPWPGVILQDRPHANSALEPAPAQIRAWEHDGARYALQARVRTFSVFSPCPPKVRSR